MIVPLSITGLSSISSVGSSSKMVWNNYLNSGHFFSEKQFLDSTALVSQLCKSDKNKIEELRASNTKYKNLDDSVLFALYASRNAIKQSGWKKGEHFGINIGSSRGATNLFEKHYSYFLENGKAQTLSSPTTTLGNISSWVAHDLHSNGPEISHSITCSTALHSVLNGVAWINSGLTNKFLVGGSEAPLTAFTIAQMKALKVYVKNNDCKYPCKAFDLEKDKNTMVLGEGAAVVCLEKGLKENRLASIEGIGYATEVLEHNTSISTNGDCFQKAMQMAINDISTVDAIVMHAPGTVKGDLAEYNAIKKVFSDKIPFLTTNKWKIGHTFGASGLLSLELALLMLQEQTLIKVPFSKKQNVPKQLNKILVNAVGFGGNAVSILLSR